MGVDLDEFVDIGMIRRHSPRQSRIGDRLHVAVAVQNHPGPADTRQFGREDTYQVRTTASGSPLPRHSVRPLPNAGALRRGLGYSSITAVAAISTRNSGLTRPACTHARAGGFSGKYEP